MKKSIYIFFTLLISIYFLLIPLLLLIQQFYIHQKNQIQIEKEFYSKPIIQKTLSIEEFKKSLLTNKKEIILHHHLYDIVSYKIIKNKVILNIIEDKEETEIIHHLLSFIKTLKHLDLSSYMFLWGTSLNQFPKIQCPNLHLLYTYTSLYSFFVPLIYLTIPSPPPKRQISF